MTNDQENRILKKAIDEAEERGGLESGAPEKIEIEMTELAALNIKSSNIIAVGHAETTLRIQFKNGVYEYDGVTKEVFDQFLAAESIGKYFHRNIRGIFPYEKIK